MPLVEPLSFIREFGPALGVGVLVVLSVIRGWLVPGKTVDRLTQAADLRAEEWKAVAQTSQTRAEQADAQTATLLSEMSTQTQLLRAIQSEAARRRDS